MVVSTVVIVEAVERVVNVFGSEVEVILPLVGGVVAVAVVLRMFKKYLFREWAKFSG